MVSATPRNILSVCNSDCLQIVIEQCAKKVVSDRPELVAFAIRLVNSVLNLPDRKWRSLENSLTDELWSILLIKKIFGPAEKTFGLHASYCLPGFPATRLTFFAPCRGIWKERLKKWTLLLFFWKHSCHNTMCDCKWELLFIITLSNSNSMIKGCELSSDEF